jgi:gliding motility-associated-like protein
MMQGKNMFLVCISVYRGLKNLKISVNGFKIFNKKLFISGILGLFVYSSISMQPPGILLNCGPVITPASGVVKFTLDANGNYSIDDPTVLGHATTCDGSVITYTSDPKTLTCADLDRHFITLTASNIHPNPIAVSFSVPIDVAIDAAGNIFVADGYSCSVRKIATDGTVTTFAGGTCGYADGQGQAAMFNVIYGITIDTQGNLYVIDENHRVRKITPDGMATTLAGSGQNESEDGAGTAASFRDPKGITIDALGNLYITQGDFLVRKVTPAGVVSTITTPASNLNTPIGITTDAQGNLYVTDYTSAIKKITPDGTVTIIAGHNGSGFTDGVRAAASFNQPKGITMDNMGNLYIADSQNNAIRKVTPAGVVTTLQLYDADTGKKASLNNPIGIKFDAFGNLIVVDAANERIVRITTDGQLTTIAGNGAVGNQNGNTSTPPTLGGETSLSIPVTIISSTNTNPSTDDITPTIGSYPLNATVCAGEAIQFIAIIPSGNYVNSYQWQVNGINAGTNSPFFTSSTLKEGDRVICIAANSSSCSVPKPSLPITVHINPLPEITFNGNPTITQGSSVTLAPVIHGNITAFRWTPSNGLSSTVIRNPEAYPVTTTTYYLTVVSSSNCQITVPVTVNVIQPIKIPNTFTPNADGFNDFWKISDLVKFPNCTVDVFNRYGQALFHSKGYVKPWDGTANGNNLPPGTYYYIIDPKNNTKPLSGWVTIIR